MKKLIGYAIVSLVSFAGGGIAGYFMRKKTAEVIFEEITPEEQAEDIKASIASFISKESKKKSEQIKDRISEEFTGSEEADVKEKTIKETPFGNADTQKEMYYRKWKADSIAKQYDTRSDDIHIQPKEILTEDDEDLEEGLDQDFLNNAEEWHPVRTGADIEAGTMDDWDHWIGTLDGEYDPVEVLWFENDNVLTDEHGDPLENPGKYMGFDVSQKFNEISEDTTGDPDIRVIYNHKMNAIFQIIRKHAGYGQLTSMEEFGNDGEDGERDWIQSRYE